MAEDDIGKLIKRFDEIAARAERSGTALHTRFLTIAEQSVLLSLRLPVPVKLWGGYEGAERRVAVMGCEAENEDAELVCLSIAPTNPRFADELTHRDFLGSLMALGLERSMLGDIVVSENRGYLFCFASVSGHIIENLSEVKRTTVTCALSEAPKTGGGGGERRSVVIASERLDSIIAAVWKLPREEAKALCEKGLVYVDSRLVTKAGARLKEECVVSVRGKGRFSYLGLERETKKGRLRVIVALP